jgi:hypothetical protein
MKKTGILTSLVFALFLTLLSAKVFGEKPEGYFSHIYGDDEASWDKAIEESRKECEIILTIYFTMPCSPKPGYSKGLIGFLISKNNDLVPFPPPLTGPWGPKAGFTTIPVNFKCGIDQASGTIDIYVKGNIIKRGKKKFLRFNMYRKWDCVFKSDLPKYDPLHGKKCHDPSEDYGDYEIPLENGYVTQYPGSIYNFALELINK